MFLPISLKVKNKVLVVGGGLLAEAKVSLLLQFKFKVRLVAATVTTNLTTLINTSDQLEYFPENFDKNKSKEYCENIQFIVSADRSMDKDVYEFAKQQRILINIVDNLELSDFMFPAIIDRSPVLVAVSSSGASPYLTRKIRMQIEQILPKGLGKLATFCGFWRSFIKKSLTSFGLRKQFWEKVIDGDISEYIYRDDMRLAEQKLKEVFCNITQENSLNFENQPSDEHARHSNGHVYIIGAGPGNPDLLTLEALRLINKAEVIVYDRLVSPKILELSSRDAEKIYVGKSPGNHCLPQIEINALLVQCARMGKRVARLKGGDPMIFGQCGDEMEALRNAGISFHVSPGVTSALACAAFAQIPLTHRDFASQCIFTAGHQNAKELPWDTLINPNQTLIFYMGVSNSSYIAENLMQRGLSKDTPTAIIASVGFEKQKCYTTTLEHLVTTLKKNNVEAPAILIVGQVVKFAETKHEMSRSIGEMYDLSHNANINEVVLKFKV